MMRPAIIVLFALAGCSKSGNIERLYGGSANLEAIRSSQDIEVFRLADPKTAEVANRHYNQWPIARGPITPDAKSSGELLAILLDESTFCNWEEGKACKPHPGVMIRLKGRDKIDLTFCFECDMMSTFRGSEQIWGANFDYSHNRLLKSVISFLPDDPDLPKLIRR